MGEFMSHTVPICAVWRRFTIIPLFSCLKIKSDCERACKDVRPDCFPLDEEFFFVICNVFDNLVNSGSTQHSSAWCCTVFNATRMKSRNKKSSTLRANDLLNYF